MSLSVDFTELGGCYFSGQTNPFQGTCTGNLAGPNTRYDLDFDADSAEFTNTFLWGPSDSATLCAVRWEGPIRDCQ